MAKLSAQKFLAHNLVGGVVDDSQARAMPSHVGDAARSLFKRRRAATSTLRVLRKSTMIAQR
ncbi:hypothetical protein H6G41_05900 [Tolypothrix sp. FACHB-123]|uniref:hypothetical protein n=1 Tax=Tolypothrix sp. FACHB-123 TaxID=2692868 RepID=UPI00168460C4|nr:hypothetical protein [Tolypothrix sp. FACHB-123]MBD2354160.1 hypothetical protein [Tolypothrix sp. FACHB-123]